MQVEAGADAIARGEFREVDDADLEDYLAALPERGSR
jgi:hypothetical protein